jgi:AraC family transcriptional activator of mtrCDE
MIAPKTDAPLIALSATDLNRLMSTLEVRVVHLTECLVGPGWRLRLKAPLAPGIHYNLMGEGRAVFDGAPPISLRPNTLIIIPACGEFAFEVDDPRGPDRIVQVQDNRGTVRPPDGVRRHVAGDGDVALTLICGYFEATYGASTDLFQGLTAPIVEQFDAGGQVDAALRAALDELMAQEVGDGAMAAALMKQVMVTLLRRSLNSSKAWAERFSILSDPLIARAFAEMVERPGATHSVQSLAAVAGLSRAAFMRRFSALFGKPPMAALRDLRLRSAARALAAGPVALDQLAFEAGYRDRSGFVRAFRKLYGCDPLEFRAAVLAGDQFIGI